MATNNEKKKKDKKNERRRSIAWTEHGFRGRLEDNGRYVVCQLPPRRPRNDGRQICGGRIANTKSNLQTHYIRQHSINSARARDTKKEQGVQWPCSCGSSYINWTSLLQHIRSKHNFRGNSKAIRDTKSAVIDPKTNCVIDPRTNRPVIPGKKNHAEAVDEDGEDDEDDEEDDIYFVPPHEDGPQDPKYKDDGHDDGQGPSGAAGSLIEATA